MQRAGRRRRPDDVDAEARLPLGRTQPQGGEPTSLDFGRGAADDDDDEMEDAGEAGGGMDID